MSISTSKPRLPSVIDEAYEIYEDCPYYIAPVRFDILMQTAAKVIKTINNIAAFDVTYTEMEMVLNIAAAAIREATHGHRCKKYSESDHKEKEDVHM